MNFACRVDPSVPSTGSTGLLLAGVVLLLMPVQPAAAQGGGQERAREAKHQADCRLAHQVLTTGQPAVKRDWALAKIGTCRELGGEALAAQLDDHRLTGERTDRLEQVVLATSRFVDREIVRATLEIAADPAAGTVARVQAIRVLSYQIAPASHAPYESYVQPGGTLFARATESVVVGTPLQDGTCTRIRSVLAEVHEAASTPEPVRIAARNVAEQALAEESTCGR